jgi:hypothetical protein
MGRSLVQHGAGERRAWHQRRQADRDAADVEGVKSVDILGGIDRRDHPVGTDLRRQRKLNQNAMHIAIAVELGEQRQQLVLARRRQQAMIRRPHAGFDHHLLLGADIDLARRIVADQHHRQTRGDATLSAKALDCRPHARRQQSLFRRSGPRSWRGLLRSMQFKPDHEIAPFPCCQELRLL